MSNDKNPADKPGSFDVHTLVAAVIAIGAMGVIIMLAPSDATSRNSIDTAESYAGPKGYLPDEIPNQAKEIEPMPDSF